MHLKQVITQGSEETVHLTSPDDLLHHWDSYKKVLGRDPAPDAECTGDKLTGVDSLLKCDMAPYIDFGVWSPSKHRLMKKLRNTGLQLHVGETLKTIEIAGLADIRA